MISFIASIYNYFFVNNQQNNESNVMLIQSVYKMHQEKKQFNKIKKATIKIQRFWRNYLQKNKNKKENSISDISQNVKQECINYEENFCYKKRFNKNKNNKKNKKQNRKFNKKNLPKI